MDLVLDIVLDAVLDALKMLPFLFGAYLLLEFLEHKAGGKLATFLQKLGPFGPVGGAVLGCVPQCGFSVAASNLYAGRLITLGTLMAVFLSTSDEAIPILLAHPDKLSVLWKLLLIKVIIAAVAGIIIDSALRFGRKKAADEEPFHEICAHCGCEHHGIFRSALSHTINIFIFILIVNLVMTSLMTVIGAENVSAFLKSIENFQPAIAGLIGLIPNCAASVVLTELYVDGGLTFGSMIAGLSTGAGMGIVILFRANKHLKQNFCILGLLYAIGVVCGMVIDLIGFAGV